MPENFIAYDQRTYDNLKFKMLMTLKKKFLKATQLSTPQHTI